MPRRALARAASKGEKGAGDVAGEGAELVGVDPGGRDDGGVQDGAERRAGEGVFAVHGGEDDGGPAVGVGCHWK